ncbi:hypothetical protein F5Y18DRAFT_378183 [Xylariaceae sp. FL1019]|nr:hypothetical protein F5Y18DRAFT_378183 [Xylariaceae sp. FL1019]
MPAYRKNGKRADAMARKARLAEADRWDEERRAARTAWTKSHSIRALDHLFAKPSDYDNFGSQSPNEDEDLAPIGASPPSQTINSPTHLTAATLISSHDATEHTKAMSIDDGILRDLSSKESTNEARGYTTHFDTRHSATTPSALASNMKNAVSLSTSKTNDRHSSFVSDAKALEHLFVKPSSYDAPGYSSSTTSHVWDTSSTTSCVPKASTGRAMLPESSHDSARNTALAGTSLNISKKTTGPLGKRSRPVFDEDFEQDSDDDPVNNPLGSTPQVAAWWKRVTSIKSRGALDGGSSDEPLEKKQRTTQPIPRRTPSVSANNSVTDQDSGNESDDVQFLYTKPVRQHGNDLDRSRPVTGIKPIKPTNSVQQVKSIRPIKPVKSSKPLSVASRRCQARQQPPILDTENTNTDLHIEGSLSNVIEARNTGQVSLCGERPWSFAGAHNSW